MSLYRNQNDKYCNQAGFPKTPFIWEICLFITHCWGPTMSFLKYISCKKSFHVKFICLLKYRFITVFNCFIDIHTESQDSDVAPHCGYISGWLGWIGWISIMPWEILLSVSQHDDFKKLLKNSTNCFPNFAHFFFLDSSVVFL